MSFLLLLSSSGITYAQHFCGDYEMMSKITLGEEHLSCGMMDMMQMDCEDESAEDHNCCDNEYTNVDTDENFAGVSTVFQVHQNFVFAFVSTFVLNTPFKYNTNHKFYQDYRPPPLEKDLVVLHETFLI